MGHHTIPRVGGGGGVSTEDSRRKIKSDLVIIVMTKTKTVTSAPVMMKLERLRRERFHTNMVCVDYCNYSLSTSGPPYNSQGGGGGGVEYLSWKNYHF